MHLTQRQREALDEWLRQTEDWQDINCLFFHSDSWKSARYQCGTRFECYTHCASMFEKVGQITKSPRQRSAMLINACPQKLYPNAYIRRRVKHYMKGS